MISVAGAGKTEGAVNIPPGENTPTVAFPPGMPATLQLTEVLDEFVTVAVKAIASPSNTDELLGTIRTETGADLTTEPVLDAVAPQPFVITVNATMQMTRIAEGPDTAAHIAHVSRCPSDRCEMSFDTVRDRARRLPAVSTAFLFSSFGRRTRGICETFV